MGFLGKLRNRLSGRGNEDIDRPSTAATSPDAFEGKPFKGYDSLDAPKLIAGLNGYSQAKLKTIEEYERAHQNRVEVLNKLRFMRGAEPLEGYDELNSEQVAAALEQADVEVIKKVRAYERKFAGRKAVLEVVNRTHSERLAARPAQAPPAYQAGGGSHDQI